MVTTEQQLPDTLELGVHVRDTLTGAVHVVIEDRGPRVLVAGLKALEPTASLIERSQRVLPRAELGVL